MFITMSIYEAEDNILSFKMCDLQGNKINRH